MDGLTNPERKVLAFLATVNSGAWYPARRIVDYADVFRGLSNRSKAGAATAMLKKLHAAGLVERESTEAPSLWRLKQS